MPTKSMKQIQGPSLYKTFIDAFMKAHPNEKRAVILCRQREMLFNWLFFGKFR